MPATVVVQPGVQFDRDDFWVSSAAASTNERFAGQTAFEDNRFLGIGQIRSSYSEYQFEANGLTYRYLGTWELNSDGSLLSSTATASGIYNTVIVEQNGVEIARLVPDQPLPVNFGSSAGLNVAGLIDLQPVLGLLLTSDSDQAFENIHLAATPTLPDIAGVPADIDGPGTGGQDGTTGGDLIDGTAANDTISGLEGNDTINGGEGNDTLLGNQGNDSVTGGAGNDWAHGGQGNDWVSGGEGADTLSGGLGADIVYGNGGNDVIFGGNEEADPADDADTIYGGQGADTIYGNGSGDVIYGGDGDTDLTDTGDLIWGGRGNDTISGNAGDDQLYGQREADVLYGGAGNDYLHGGQENDALFGGEGNDTIVGGLGNDALTGGSGSDLFVFGTGAGNDVIADFTSADRLDLEGQSYVLAANSGGDALLQLSGGGTITLTGVSVGAFDDAYVI